MKYQMFWLNGYRIGPISLPLLLPPVFGSGHPFMSDNQCRPPSSSPCLASYPSPRLFPYLGRTSRNTNCTTARRKLKSSNGNTERGKTLTYYKNIACCWSCFWTLIPMGYVLRWVVGFGIRIQKRYGALRPQSGKFMNLWIYVMSWPLNIWRNCFDLPI